MKENLLWRRFFDDTGNSFLQLCIPKHLRDELLYRIHNSKFGGHIGIKKTLLHFREKFYFPGSTEAISRYIRNCISCLANKSAKEVYQTPPLHQLASAQDYPGDMLQIDIVGKMEPSGRYTHILTAMDVFSKYLFAIPVTKVSAISIAKELFDLFMRHSYIPTTILTDQGSVFVSRLMQELANLLEIELKHATVKHAQTIGLLERTHSSIKKVLKIYDTKRWANYVDLACFIYNTSYHTSLGCSPTLLFHGRQPYNPVDLRFRTNWKKDLELTTDTVTAIQDRMSDLLRRTKDNVVIAYLKYRQYYDEKAKAQPLKRKSYCLLLNPKMVTQGDPLNKSKTKWIPLYQVEKVLTYSNYLVRKVGTCFTQCVHRIRLRPVTPQYEVEDIEDVSPEMFQKDPTIPEGKSEPESFDDYLKYIVKPDVSDFAYRAPEQEARPTQPSQVAEPSRQIPVALPDFTMPESAAVPNPEPQPAPTPQARPNSRYGLRQAINPPQQLHETVVGEMTTKKRVTFQEPRIVYRPGSLVNARLAIGHCISADAAMGAGIAKTLATRTQGLKRHVSNKKPKVGTVVPFYTKDNGRIRLIY